MANRLLPFDNALFFKFKVILLLMHLLQPSLKEVPHQFFQSTGSQFLNRVDEDKNICQQARQITSNQKARQITLKSVSIFCIWCLFHDANLFSYITYYLGLQMN